MKIPKGVIRIRKSKNSKHNGQKKKKQKDKQRSTKHTHKIKYRVTRTPLKRGGELRCSGRVGSSCSSKDTRHVNLVTNSVISHEWGNNYDMRHLDIALSVLSFTASDYPFSTFKRVFQNEILRQKRWFKFPIVIHLYVSTFQQHLHMEYIRYSRGCSFYHDYLDAGILLTTKPVNKVFLVIKLKSSSL